MLLGDLMLKLIMLIPAMILGTQTAAKGAKTEQPNIIYILADDLGIGDVGSFNPDGKIATPFMDRLAAEGMKFTDAHSGSAVCTPTRYGILTGRYAWRTHLSSGVLWGYSMPLIASGRLTVASLLRQQGFNTACVGKWHLGLEWVRKDPKVQPVDGSQELWHNYDFSGRIASGPNQVGFDDFFGIPASLDMQPHVYIQNDHVTSVPMRIIDGSTGKRFWRKGPVGDDFRHTEVLDKLTDRAVEYINAQSTDKPFFLYFPLPAPHKPILPTKRFEHKSGLNEWGDFVMQVDWTIGQVMQAVDARGLAENTLLIVTSDNGATPGADFAALGSKGHDPSGRFRGHKADIFEGGHRVAFIARWPSVIPSGTMCDDTICHTDLLATVAEIIGVNLPGNAGEDSVSILPLMNQTAERPIREATVHHSINGAFSIRRGKWKLCFCPGSGGWSSPRPSEAKEQEVPAIQLFDLSSDIAETNNVQADHPELVEELSNLLQRYINNGRSTPGEQQSNDRAVSFASQ
ncbi:MAG: arylsulfatase [Fuerstiella sp.]|nr:arylsulfatase [Fuerstiella sp.]